MRCPNPKCGKAIPAGSTKHPDCGWGYEERIPRVKCSTIGCELPAFNRVDDKNLCQVCEELLRHEEAQTFCKAHGLNSVDEMRAYCRRVLKQVFSRPSFERWAATITQKTVDHLVMMNGPDDRKVLERLRALGALTDENGLVPVDQRDVVRAALEAARKAERVRIEAALAAHGIVRRTAVQGEARTSV